jgi:predicted enzyme related to lactoylglutathione lyase
MMKYRQIVLWSTAMTLLSVANAHAQQTSPPNEATPPAARALTMMSASLPCSDIERSIAFYTKGLGMTVRGRIDMGSVIEVPMTLPGGGANLMLLHPKAEGTALPVRGELSRILLQVPDLKALEAQLNANGYKLTAPIKEMMQHRVAVAHIVDPDGNHLELIQRF